MEHHHEEDREPTPRPGAQGPAPLDLEDTGPSGLHPGWVLGLLAGIGLVALMLFDGFQSETYFYEVDQAVAEGPALVGQTVRLKGTVEPGTVEGRDGELGRTFHIAERGKSIQVTYDRALPDTFKEGMEVVAQGRVDQDYVLHADEVLVKCPSRYEGSPPTARPDGAGEEPRVN